MNTEKIAILIIAAGASARLGQPKQLLPFRGTFLLNYVLNECLSSELGDVFVVLGANRAAIENRLTDSPCALLYPPNWQNGMGNSLAFGITAIAKKSYTGVIVLLADQPFFNHENLAAIVKKRAESNAPIVLSKYKKGIGPPSFFDAALFPEMQKLQGDIGAKPIVQKYKSLVVTVDFEQGNLDIDTPEDLKYLAEA